MEPEMNFEERMNAEIRRRVDYYEKNEPSVSSQLPAINFVLAGLIFAAGVIMTVVGSFM